MTFGLRPERLREVGGKEVRSNSMCKSPEKEASLECSEL